MRTLISWEKDKVALHNRKKGASQTNKGSTLGGECWPTDCIRITSWQDHTSKKYTQTKNRTNKKNTHSNIHTNKHKQRTQTQKQTQAKNTHKEHKHKNEYTQGHRQLHSPVHGEDGQVQPESIVGNHTPGNLRVWWVRWLEKDPGRGLQVGNFTKRGE